ncbi:MAG: hypothetical protein LKG11_00820 [Bacilli bacterium]|jgi:plastocyanin|nr:hypothetical protein [Bacilli bacterium]
MKPNKGTVGEIIATMSEYEGAWESYTIKAGLKVVWVSHDGDSHTANGLDELRSQLDEAAVEEDPEDEAR